MKLILGNGLLGKEINKQTGWYNLNRQNQKNLDFAKIDTYKSIITNLCPDVVINCIAQTNTVLESDEDKRNDWNVNYKGVMDLVDLCNENNVKLVHISTDYVYAKSFHFASESDVPVHYSNSYTYTKLLADAYIQARSKNYLILRSSFKPRPFPHEYAWIDFVGNFDYVDVIAGLMIELIEYGAEGLYNVGTDLKTMYDLARRTNENVKPIKKDIKFIDSNDISMSTTKMENFLKIERCKIDEIRTNSRSL